MMKQNYYQTPAEVATLSPRQSNLLVDSKAVLKSSCSWLISCPFHPPSSSLVYAWSWLYDLASKDGWLYGRNRWLFGWDEWATHHLGWAPFSTLKEFSENSQLKEVPGDYNVTIEEQLARVVEVFRYAGCSFSKRDLMSVMKKVTA